MYRNGIKSPMLFLDAISYLVTIISLCIKFWDFLVITIMLRKYTSTLHSMFWRFLIKDTVSP